MSQQKLKNLTENHGRTRKRSTTSCLTIGNPLRSFNSAAWTSGRMLRTCCRYMTPATSTLPWRKWLQLLPLPLRADDVRRGNLTFCKLARYVVWTSHPPGPSTEPFGNNNPAKIIGSIAAKTTDDAACVSVCMNNGDGVGLELCYLFVGFKLETTAWPCDEWY